MSIGVFHGVSMKMLIGASIGFLHSEGERATGRILRRNLGPFRHLYLDSNRHRKGELSSPGTGGQMDQVHHLQGAHLGKGCVLEPGANGERGTRDVAVSTVESASC